METESKYKFEKFGKIFLAGGLGWAIFGPIGAIIGVVLTSIYVSGELPEYQNKTTTGKGDFTMSLLVLFAAVMKADNKVTRSELDYVKRFLIQNFGLSVTKEILIILRNILRQEINIKEVALQIRDHMDYPARLQLVHLLFGLANADGEIHPEELNIINHIVQNLEIGQGDYKSIHAMFIDNSNSYYEILEIEKNASIDEIKKAYRQMAMKYHPDRVIHLGKEYQASAKERFQKVNEAYEKIKKERGFA